MNKLYFLGIGVFTLIVLYRFVRQWSNFKNLSMFLICSKKINKIAANDALRKNLKDENYRKHYAANEAYQKDEILRLENDFTARIGLVRNSIKQGFITVFLVIIASFISADLSAKYLPISSNTIIIMRIFSAFIILWALLSKLGWPIQTFKGDTVPEKLNTFWFLLLNVIGAYLLFGTYFYSFINK